MPCSRSALRSACAPESRLLAGSRSATAKRPGPGRPRKGEVRRNKPGRKPKGYAYDHEGGGLFYEREYDDDDLGPVGPVGVLTQPPPLVQPKKGPGRPRKNPLPGTAPPGGSSSASQKKLLMTPEVSALIRRRNALDIRLYNTAVNRLSGVSATFRKKSTDLLIKEQ